MATMESLDKIVEWIEQNNEKIYNIMMKNKRTISELGRLRKLLGLMLLALLPFTLFLLLLLTLLPFLTLMMLPLLLFGCLSHFHLILCLELSKVV